MSDLFNPAAPHADLVHRESAERLIGAAKAEFLEKMHRPATLIVFNSVAVRELCKYLGPMAEWDTVTGVCPDFCGLKVMFSYQVPRAPGFVLA